MKLHNMPNILIASNIDNFSRYDGDSFGISAGFEVGEKGSAEPDAKTGKPTGVFGSDRTLGVSKSIGYGEDSDSQTSTTYSGINTSNIEVNGVARENALGQTITGNGNTEQTNSHPELVSGSKEITAANLADIFTSTTTDTIKENSGSLANTFDAQTVQNELDVQTRVTQTFDTNRQEVKAEINSVIDKAKEILKEDPNNKEAQQTVEDMQHLGILVDSISGALYSPADNALGTVANTLSPAIVYEIGQHFKEEGTEGSAAHILAQALVAAATASLAGNDELTAGLSAGGAEVIAPILADWMYDKETKDLTSDQKNTISAIISLGSATVGATTGETTDVISSSVAGTTAVEDNYLTYWEKGQRDIAKNKCNQGDMLACSEYLKWNQLDRERSFGSYFVGAVGQGFVGLYGGINKINNLDTSSMPLVTQGGLGYIMIGKERVLWENESFFNVIGRMEDIQGYIENYNNVKNLLDQNKSR